MVHLTQGEEEERKKDEKSFRNKNRITQIAILHGLLL